MLLSRLHEVLTQATLAALKKRGADVACPPFEITLPPAKVPGDVASNAALMLAKTLGASPRSIAEDIIAALPKDRLIEKADIAGAGFVNMWLSSAAFADELADIFKNTPRAPQNKKFLFEFVSANPTGPLHVGHGRGAALGDSLVRIYRYLGHSAEAEFYVNDSGGQIRNLGLSVEARLNELQGRPFAMPENGYQGKYVSEIAKEILATGANVTPVEATQMVFSESDSAGYASVRNLAAIKKVLVAFGVHFDHWYFESSLHKKNAVVSFIENLRSKELAYDQDGATWFKASQFGDDKDRVLKKANEAPTYFAADLAYHHDKFSRGFDRYVNIWGADHHGYAQRLKGALNAIGEDAGKLEVLFNQMISIKGGRMSKRAGNVVTLQDVIDDVGRDATRFFFALRSPGAHFEFDLDLAKKQANDNPVYYVQYLHARCCSIEREAAKREWPTSSSPCHPERSEGTPAVEKNEILRPCGPQDDKDLHLQDDKTSGAPCHPERSEGTPSVEKNEVLRHCGPQDDKDLHPQDDKTSGAPCHPERSEGSPAVEKNEVLRHCGPQDDKDLHPQDDKTSGVPCHPERSEGTPAVEKNEVLRPCGPQDDKPLYSQDDKALRPQDDKVFALHPAEKDVILCLAQFDRVVEKCAADFSNHHLTVYLQELAGRFHSFYEHCHVLVEDAATREFRLTLVRAIRRRVAQGLDLLGVSAPEQL